jgi:hypothetical protein
MLPEHEYKNRMYSDAENLDYAIGAVQFRDNVITNLRTQIASLRTLALQYHCVEYVDDLQYAHQRLPRSDH